MLTEQRAEASFLHRIAINLAADAANDPAKPCSQALELAPGAIELDSVGIAADHDGGALGEPDELDDCPMHQPRVGRMRNGLGLHAAAISRPAATCDGMLHP